MSEAVFVEGLTKTYNGKTVVNHLNLSVKSGTVFGLLGANGAGKSTTIECMLGTKQADSGTVRLLGIDPKKKRRTLFKRVGVQFQEGDYQKEIKVSELCEETPQAFTAALPIGASSVSSSVLGIRQTHRSKVFRAVNASVFLSYWR